MDNEEQALQELKAKMTPEQRKDMADLLQAELRRRMDEKKKVSNGISREKSAIKSSAFGSAMAAEDVGDVYRAIDDDVRSLRLRKLEAQLEDARRQSAKYGKYLKGNRRASQARGVSALREAASQGMPLLPVMGGRRVKQLALMAVIVVLAGLKVLSSTGLVDASTREKVELRPDSRAMLSMPRADKVSPDGIKKKGGESEETSEPVMNAVQVPSMNVANGSLTEAEKRVLLSLDDRRVELERRKASLDKKEAEIKKQTRVLAERMAELRSLTARLAEVREEKDRKYDVRMEQLAGVYGSMAPNEAAPLIAKLDEKIALALLQRMTGKRMGQILSVMDPEQAVALTKSLTDRQKL